METVGRHNGSCATAKRHECNCTGCGGALHGWGGWIELARQTSDTGRTQRRCDVDRSWRNAFSSKSRRTVTKLQKAAGTDSAILDIVDWMARDRSTSGRRQAIDAQGSEAGSQDQEIRTGRESRSAASASQDDDLAADQGEAKAVDSQVPGGDEIDQAVIDYVEQIAVAITGTRAELDRSFTSTNLRAARRDLLNHFWCDLFIALAQAIDRGIEELDKVPERVTRIILSASKNSERSLITEMVVKHAVEKAWEALMEIPAFGINHFKETARALRILAVLTCPDSEHHKEVVEQGFVPLRKEMLTTATKDRLEKVLPSGWTHGL
jgi:hypothetical protein